MIQCYYVITNLKNGNDKAIPVFEILTKDDFQWLLSENSDIENINLTESDKEKLKEFLKDHIHHKTVESLVTDKINLNNLISEVNEKIKSSFSENDFWKALNIYLKKNKKSVKEIVNLLSSPSKKTEDKIIKMLNEDIETLADTNLTSQINELTDTINELESVGDPSSYYKNLKTFLTIANSVLDWKDSKTLIKVESGIKQGSWNLNKRLVFLDSEDKHNLFTGLLKRISSELSEDDFIELFSEWNEAVSTWGENYSKYLVDLSNIDVNSFFSGVVTKDSIEPPKFNEILELKDRKLRKIQTALDNLLDRWFVKIATNMGDKRNVTEETKRSYYNIIRNLFSLDKFIEEIQQVKTSEEVADNLIQDSLHNLHMLGLKREDGNNRYGLNYKASTVLKFEDLQNIPNLYDYFIRNFTINKDIIRMPKIGQNNPHHNYWLVSAIYPRGDKVLVYGKRLSDNGKSMEGTSFLFSRDSEITFRKYSDYKDIDSEDKPQAKLNVNSYAIRLPNKITFELAKNLLSVGDMIGTRRITGIYPGHFTTFDIKTNTEHIQYYSKEFEEDAKNKWSVLSKKLWDLMNENDVGKLWLSPNSKIAKNRASNDPEFLKHLSEGDYFKLPNFKGYNRVIFADKMRVWAVIETADKEDNVNYILKSYLKSEIESGITFPFENSSEILEIIKLYDEDIKKIGNDSELSTFYDPSVAKEGDFVIIDSKNFDKSYGKIIDLENGIALLWNKKLQVWEKRSYVGQNVKFMSKDPRINKSSIYNIMSNMWKIHIDKKGDSETNKNRKKVFYVVSKDTPKEEVDFKMKGLIQNTAYTDIGKYIEASHMDEKWENKTNDIIKLLGGHPDHHDLYVNILKGTVNTYERDFENARLHKINNIEVLSDDFIKENMLFKGAYISIFSKSFIDPNLYVVERVTDADVYVRQYFKNKYGKVIMQELKIPIETLVNRKTSSDGKRLEGSIAHYYLQKGNNKFKDIVSEIKEKSSPSKDDSQTSTQNINSLKKRIESLFSELGVSVEYSNKTSDFSDGQKAKFTTQLTEEGPISKIIVKKDLGKREDLVHETMHLFLSALRLTSPETYMNVLNTVLDAIPDQESLKDMSLLKKEELFIHELQYKLNDLKDDFFTRDMDLETLLSGLYEASEIINPDILPKNINVNIYDVLTQPIVKFLNLKTKSTTHVMMNANLAQLTPTFMRWLEENNYNLKCN